MISDEAVEVALKASVPGGLEVWCWLPQKDAWTPHETARDVIRAALEAALPHLLASQGCGTRHSGEPLEPDVGATAALAQELPEGFKPWSGGTCPVPGQLVMWINARGHSNQWPVEASTVCGWDWHDPSDGNYPWRIIGYRVVHAHPQKGGEG